jgi:hypothetical protein
MVEKKSGHQIEFLRADIGGEYDSIVFYYFYKKHGIK